MNILIVANHYAVCSARYAADAFTRLGHTVRHVGPAMGRNIWGMQVPEEYVWTPDNVDVFVETNGITYGAYSSLMASNELFKPDLTIVMDSDPAILDEQSNVAKYQGTPVIVYGVDNHCREYRRQNFSHYFLAHKSVSVMEWGFNRGASPEHSYYAANTDMTHLPCAYDPVAFPPSPIAWADRQFDVCMIGVLYPKRWELVQAMRAAGLKVFAGTGLVYDAYKQAYWNSRVALVSSFKGDLPIRLFEGAGMGCAVLADFVMDLEVLDPLHPTTTYTDIPNAVVLAMDMQSRPDFADACAKWAAAHTFDKRAQVIIDWAEARS